MLKPAFTFFLTCTIILAIQAQSHQLTGRITDEQGNPVPFASIYKKEGTAGTAANNDGVFTLRLPSGGHELIIRAVGFKQTTERVVLKQDTHLEVTLHTESFLLDEVIIGNGEDPAYAIIRQAIRNRRKHLEEAAPYTAKSGA